MTLFVELCAFLMPDFTKLRFQNKKNKTTMNIFKHYCKFDANIKAPCTLRVFNVTSDQANFASHHTRDHHVGFPLAWEGIGKSNKTFHNFLFSSYHITKLQLSGKNIITHTR